MDIHMSEPLCALEVLWHEARGEPEAGQVAVLRSLLRQADERGLSMCSLVDIEGRQRGRFATGSVPARAERLWPLVLREFSTWDLPQGEQPKFDAGSTHWCNLSASECRFHESYLWPAADIGRHRFYVYFE